MEYLENRTFDEIKIGDTASLKRTLTEKDIQLFAIMSGDINPAHVDKIYAQSDMFHHIIGHGMWGGALISTVLGTELPGIGTIYLDQTLQFKKPVSIGDTLKVTVKAIDKKPQNYQVVFDCECTNQRNEIVISGQAVVIAPKDKIKRLKTELPTISFHRNSSVFNTYIEQAKQLPSLLTAIVHPITEEALGGAIEAVKAGLIIPILIGPRKKIMKAAEAYGVDISAYELINTEHSHAAADKAVDLAYHGDVKMIMKGSLHTDELMHAAFKAKKGLTTDRCISHVFLMDIPTYPKPLILTDAAINIEPTLDAKRDIVQNAIDFALALGIEKPKVAILAAVETVNSKMLSTLHAAALCKMAERGQIQNGILDGPLAFDNVISEQAAKIKGIESKVAGKADVLVAPNLETANMLAKQLEYLAETQVAGVVLGARVPIVLTSRADDSHSRLASCALAVLYAKYQHKKLREKLRSVQAKHAK
jgi:phosphotransacetylase/acyl dehydratase